MISTLKNAFNSAKHYTSHAFNTSKTLAQDFTAGLIHAGKQGRRTLHTEQFKLAAGALALSLTLAHGNVAGVAASTIPVASSAHHFAQSGHEWRAEHPTHG